MGVREIYGGKVKGRLFINDDEAAWNINTPQESWHH